MNKVTLKNIVVGDDEPVVFMAEMGTFYNQDIKKACDIAAGVAEAGADVIKTEILHDPNIVLNDPNVTVTYNHHSGSTTEKYFDLIKRKSNSLDDYQVFFDFLATLNKPIVASVYDFKGIDFLVKNNAAGIKLWRNNYNNFPLIKVAAQTKLPIIFDFVNTSSEDMLKAVDCAVKNNAGGIIVNYHPGVNPANPAEHNLKLLEKYKKLFGFPVGLSCHYRGNEIMYASIGAGVNIIEKGVFDDLNSEDQNVVSAASLSELPEIIAKIKICSTAIGNGEPQKAIRNEKLLYGFVVAENIPKGTELNWKNLRMSFPQLGISVEEAENILGRKANKDLIKGNPLLKSDVE